MAPPPLAPLRGICTLVMRNVVPLMVGFTMAATDDVDVSECA